MWSKHWRPTSSCEARACCGCAQYDEEPGHEAFADDFQQAMTYFTKLSLTGGEVRPRQQSRVKSLWRRECRRTLACSGSFGQALIVCRWALRLRAWTQGASRQ